MGKRKNIIVGVVLFGTLILFGVYFSQYQSYRANGGEPQEVSFERSLAILNPTHGSSQFVGSQVFINTIAVSDNPILFTELWINGVLVSIQGGLQNESDTQSSIFTWLPDTAGTYVLSAKMIDSEQNQMYSNSVLVFVVSPDQEIAPEQVPAIEGEQAALNPAPVVFPLLDPGDIPPPPTPPADDLVPYGGSWTGSLSDWFNSLTVEFPPEAPGLTATVDGCDVNFIVVDNSNNEEGFMVFRQASKSDKWIKVATLSSHPNTGLNLFVYTDTVYPGGFSYYVTSFNSKGDAPSNLVVVNIDPKECVPEIVELPHVNIYLIDIFTDIAVDKWYCYGAIGENHWIRFPDVGFFPGGEDGVEINESIFKWVVDNYGEDALTEFEDLHLSCWGWAGDEFKKLGDIVFPDLDPENTGEFLFGEDGLSAKILIDFAKNVAPETFPIGDIDLSIFSVAIDLGDLVKPQSNQMPFIAAWISYDPEFCKNHLEPKAQNPLGVLFLCQPYPGFNVGPGGASPQPYLVWTMLNNTCAAGYEDECLPYDFWLKYVEQRQGELVFEIRDYFIRDGIPDNNAYQFWFIDEPYRTAWTVDLGEYTCDSTKNGIRYLQVILQLKSGWIGNIQGPKSNLVKMPCPNAIENTVFIEVEYESIVILDLSEEEDFMEIYGGYHANNTSSPISGTMNIEFATVALNKANSNFFKNFVMCQEISKIHGMCGGSQSYNDWYTNNNVLLISVSDGDAILLSSGTVNKADSEKVCFAQLGIESRTLEQWAATNNEEITLLQPGVCHINVILNAIKP